MTERLLDMRGCRALVVGGGQGMGRASALLLARAGARVVVLDEVAERAEAVVAELGATDAVALVADVTERAAAEDAVAEAAARLDGLDAVVNVVGGASWAPLLELGDEVWERDLRVNLAHHRFVGAAAARAMIAAGEG
ncbi:MAG: SDR family NAD(P)-dependent oxidoreductase, partial [Myxococcota bacterium]